MSFAGIRFNIRVVMVFIFNVNLLNTLVKVRHNVIHRGLMMSAIETEKY